MVSLKNKKGFTIVELLIVIVVIGILATLVIVTFTGIQQKARNSQRQTDINAVDSHVEAYYAQTGNYPTLANLNDSTWRSTNMKGLDEEALKDPKITAAQETAPLADTVSNTQYSYVVTPANCDNTATMCDAFTLTANLEGGGTYVKKSN